MNDTGKNFPETRETLILQQRQLLQRKIRLAQMFPLGTLELELLPELERVETHRGVFHYDPERVSDTQIIIDSVYERENLLLGLGPYSKHEIIQRVQEGQYPLVVVERTLDGVEVKCALGTDQTVMTQLQVFHEDKLSETLIRIENAPDVLRKRMM